MPKTDCRELTSAKVLKPIFSQLKEAIELLKFGPPVTHVYNPLTYAKKPFDQYIERYLAGPISRTLLLGMNPGPWGMAQTGVPFGEVSAVRDWLGITAEVGRPAGEHPARPIMGFDCHRKEVSGQRLWSLFSQHYPNAQDFARSYVIINYCPLVFMEESGRNRTPDRLPKTEREPLYRACNEALSALLQALKPGRTIGIGKFAQARLANAIKTSNLALKAELILHPSPANPQANAGWAEQVLPVLGPWA